ncbi:inositol 2-dehydrogenase [Pseudoroseomonas wenyumeiae]|uniref:Inositol 2-dehydrogenase n=1 Tax=Teichococcus wenyumeiae TaxID=2478470 RepID=A0A3A9JHI6_9PROT|nr:inositol 2-dehydrogenase [Pseudoroseomonas wenyumeiae]RKK06012.1 inositol 2-dehydrogenase [Pseudoroseomonas wenyumeiae]RMI19529.1 inositol 2-dehydrogenase [Pseudoroseomonas wenyumeiae]
MLSIAVIGAGRIGRIHARNIALHPRARLAGVSDTDSQAASSLAESCGAGAIPLEEAFKADAVLIGSPTPTHADYIERAAAAGCAVFCEKPIDLSIARVRDCLAVVERAGTPLMVGFNRRFDPSFASLRRRLSAGEIGNLELLTITSRDPAPPPASYVAQSGGLFRDMMIHDLDMARFLLGEEPVELYAAASALVDKAIGEAGDVDTAVVTLKTASGKLCQISNSRRATYGYDQRIEAHGSEGLLRAGNMTSTTVEAAGRNGFTTEPALPFFLERYDAAYRAELDAFVAAVLDGTPAGPGGEDGLRALILADAATESARSGRPVSL